MKSWALCFFCLWGILGCEASSPEIHIPDADDPISMVSVEDEGLSFQDVLKQHQALNARLDHVTYRLRAASAELCPETDRSLGLTVHTIEDYPDDLKDLARATLAVSDKVSVRTVWKGSPAEAAGVRAGDIIVSIAGYELPSGLTAKKLYEAVIRQSLNANVVGLSIYRGDEVFSVELRPETLCGYESRILWVDQINAFTNGETLLVTSELLRATPDEDSLAMFIAHEMAHAIARHVEKPPSRSLELEADRMGLVLMARAGFDIESAVTNWINIPHPHFSDPKRVSTHPTMEERLENFEVVLDRIAQMQKSGEPLYFE